MKRINYFASCPCCGKVHVISVEYGLASQFDLDDAVLSLCSCPAAIMRHDCMRAKENRENGFTDMAKDAIQAIEAKSEDCRVSQGGVRIG